MAFLRWLGTISERLKRYKSERHTRVEFLNTLWYESKRAGLEAELVLGLIQVESAFRKYAISVVGARGYMQVMPFWARLIGDGDPGKLFHMQTNLRFGCVILRHYLERERGDLFLALGRYNGSRGRPSIRTRCSPRASAGSPKARSRPAAAPSQRQPAPSTRSTESSTNSSIVCGRW